MAIQNEPTRISTPFADAGTKNVIPETMAQPSATAAASWQAGFPTVCSLPLSAGGIPPARNDFNGLFNQLSQTSRFLQDGGIFAWDASTDYGANRLVLGSDGKLYWSVAQSGPNTGAGAVDPTTDSGAYWGSLPMKAPSLGANGDELVTAKWVQAFNSFDLYVDSASGAATNDGMTPGTPVNSITTALNKANEYSKYTVRIHLLNSVFTEDITIDNKNIHIVLSDNTTINGYLSLIGSTYLYISDTNNNSYTLTISNQNITPLSLFNSTLFTDCSLYIASSNSDYSVDAYCNSIFVARKNVTIDANSISSAVFNLSLLSHAQIEGSFQIQGSSSNSGIHIDIHSSAIFRGNVIESDMFSRSGFSLLYNGSVTFSGQQVVIYGGSNDASLYVANGSSIYSFDSDITITNNSSTCISCIRNSAIVFDTISGKTISLNPTNSQYALLAFEQSLVSIPNDGYLTINGSVSSATVKISTNSLLATTGDIHMAGTVTGGVKYQVSEQSAIGIYQGDIIPGDGAGQAWNDGAYY